MAPKIALAGFWLPGSTGFEAVLGSSGLRSLCLFFTAPEGGVSLDG